MSVKIHVLSDQQHTLQTIEGVTLADGVDKITQAWDKQLELENNEIRSWVRMDGFIFLTGHDIERPFYRWAAVIDPDEQEDA